MVRLCPAGRVSSCAAAVSLGRPWLRSVIARSIVAIPRRCFVCLYCAFFPFPQKNCYSENRSSGRNVRLSTPNDQHSAPFGTARCERVGSLTTAVRAASRPLVAASRHVWFRRETLLALKDWRCFAILVFFGAPTSVWFEQVRGTSPTICFFSVAIMAHRNTQEPYELAFLVPVLYLIHTTRREGKIEKNQDCCCSCDQNE